ncbi:MAG: glycosyltransferase family 4 protein, partial [Pseudomonadota bacterium]
IVTRNLEPIYDIATALRALALLRATCPGAHMTIAGEGPERAMLTALTCSLGVTDHVVFTGGVDNERMQDLYRRADLFLNSSVVDNMPNSILEALASGVPVVSTDAGGIPFMVEHGKTALLVPPRDAHALARAVLELLNDPDQAGRLAKEGLSLAQQYSWANVRARLFNVYSALVKETPAHSVVESK